jgi:hypothetical protein
MPATYAYLVSVKSGGGYSPILMTHDRLEADRVSEIHEAIITRHSVKDAGAIFHGRLALEDAT